MIIRESTNLPVATPAIQDMSAALLLYRTFVQDSSIQLSAFVTFISTPSVERNQFYTLLSAEVSIVDDQYVTQKMILK